MTSIRQTNQIPSKTGTRGRKSGSAEHGYIGRKGEARFLLGLPDSLALFLGEFRSDQDRWECITTLGFDSTFCQHWFPPGVSPGPG